MCILGENVQHLPIQKSNFMSRRHMSAAAPHRARPLTKRGRRTQIPVNGKIALKRMAYEPSRKNKMDPTMRA